MFCEGLLPTSFLLGTQFLELGQVTLQGNGHHSLEVLVFPPEIPWRPACLLAGLQV